MTSKMNAKSNRRDSLTSCSSTRTFALNSTSVSLFSVENEDNVSLALRQETLFKFTSASFLDHYWTFIMQYWAEAINQVAIPCFIEQLGKDAPKGKALEELRIKLLDRIHQNGKLTLIFQRAQRFCDKVIFKIPRDINITGATNDGEEGTSSSSIVALAREEINEEELWEEIDKIQQDIIKLRIQIMLVNEETEKAKMYHQFLAKIRED